MNIGNKTTADNSVNKQKRSSVTWVCAIFSYIISMFNAGVYVATEGYGIALFFYFVPLLLLGIAVANTYLFTGKTIYNKKLSNILFIIGAILVIIPVLIISREVIPIFAFISYLVVAMGAIIRASSYTDYSNIKSTVILCIIGIVVLLFPAIVILILEEGPMFLFALLGWTFVGGVIFKFVQFVYHAVNETKYSRKKADCAHKIIELYTKYHKTDKSTLPSFFIPLDLSSAKVFLDDYKFYEFFEKFDPNAVDGWTCEDKEEYFQLRTEYCVYKTEFDKHFRANLSSKRSNELNEALANSGTPFAADAKQELAGIQAKADRNAVIKAGVVGGIIAGKTGAIIGAVAKKTEIDSKNNGNKGG